MEERKNKIMKKKIVLLGATVAMSLGLAGAVAAFTVSNGMLEGKASNVTAGSIVFSRATGSFTKIDDKTASVSGRTAKGATYYAVSRNNVDISSGNYIAQFGSGRGYDEQYVSFSDTATGTSDFEFQAVTSIKVTTSATTTLYAYVSNDGVSFSTSVAIAGSTSPSVVSLGGSYKYVRLGVSNIISRNVSAIELIYDCGEEPEPSKQPDHIAPVNAQRYYEQGEKFVEPEVRMYYTDESSTVLTSGVTFSGYDAEELGDQTITVSYTGPEGHFETTYTINVYIPTLYTIDYNMFNYGEFDYVDMNDYLDFDESDLDPSFEEGKSAHATIVLQSEEYEVVWISIEEDEDWDSFSSVDGETFTFSNLPDTNITVTIWIAPVEE